MRIIELRIKKHKNQCESLSELSLQSSYLSPNLCLNQLRVQVRDIKSILMEFSAKSHFFSNQVVVLQMFAFCLLIQLSDLISIGRANPLCAAIQASHNPSANASQ